MRIMTKERDWEIQMLLGYICCARRAEDEWEDNNADITLQEWAVDNRSARVKRVEGSMDTRGSRGAKNRERLRRKQVDVDMRAWGMRSSPEERRIDEIEGKQYTTCHRNVVT